MAEAMANKRRGVNKHALVVRGLSFSSIDRRVGPTQLRLRSPTSFSSVTSVSEAAEQPGPPTRTDIRQAPIRPPLSSNLPTPLDQIDHRRPRSVKLSVCLWVLAALPGIAVLAYFGTKFNEIRDAVTETVENDRPSLSSASVDRAVNAILGIILGLLAVPSALILLLAPLMARRRNWARILLAIVGMVAPVLAAVAVVLMTADTFVEPLWLIVAISIQAVLVLGGLVAMFRPNANAWYRARLLTM